MIEGEVSEKNEEKEDQVGEKGAKMRGHPSWLGIGIINQSIDRPVNVQHMGGWVEPLWPCWDPHPGLTRQLVRVLGFHTGYDD